MGTRNYSGECDRDARVLIYGHSFVGWKSAICCLCLLALF